MEQQQIIEFWIDSSDKDYKAMLNLYKSRDYTWCLFIGHLVIEKLLKALYVKKLDINTPRTHDLLRLAEKMNLGLDDEKKDILDLITTFNISARYPDYKQSFYKRCTDDFAKDNISKIEGMRSWLKLILLNK